MLRGIYVAAIAAVLRLSTETINWTNSEIFGKIDFSPNLPVRWQLRESEAYNEPVFHSNDKSLQKKGCLLP